VNPLLIKRLLANSGAPPPFHPGTRDMWTDPYISRRALSAHFDPTHDDASRRPKTIDASVSWIRGCTQDAPGRKVLDLGCGPGLYAERFARSGYRVTGMDVSRPALSCARRRARSDGLDIAYRRGDYRRSSLPEGQSVVTLIYGGFCVISEQDRSRLLDRVRAALVPGGYFVFDVFTRTYTEEERLSTEWYVRTTGGFWYEGAHLVLEESMDYPGELMLNRYTVVPALGRVRRFHLWYQPYSPDGIQDLLVSSGFRDVELRGDLTGAPLEHEGPWVGVVCRK
jgi:SAM-dependent methyltransferase